MRYQIDSGIFDLAPDFCRAVVMVWGADNTAGSGNSLESDFRRRIASIASDDNISVKHDRIAAWKKLYKRLGLKDVQPSIAALVRRIKAGNGNNIPFISPLVCISNLISLSHLTPGGLVDAARVEGDFVLGLAQGVEIFEPIGGHETMTVPAGEFIYYDSQSLNVMCRGLNSRGGKATCVSPETTNVIIDIDGLLEVVPREELDSAAHSLQELVQQYCGGQTAMRFLDKGSPHFQFDITKYA